MLKEFKSRYKPKILKLKKKMRKKTNEMFFFSNRLYNVSRKLFSNYRIRLLVILNKNGMEFHEDSKVLI